MEKRNSRHCSACQRPTLHSKQFMIGDGMGCLLTLLTAGKDTAGWYE